MKVFVWKGACARSGRRFSLNEDRRAAMKRVQVKGSAVFRYDYKYLVVIDSAVRAESGRASVASDAVPCPPNCSAVTLEFSEQM